MGTEKLVFVLFTWALIAGLVVCENDRVDQSDHDMLVDILKQLANVQEVNDVLLSKVDKLEETTKRLESENKELKQRVLVLENTAHPQVHDVSPGETTENTKKGKILHFSETEYKGVLQRNSRDFVKRNVHPRQSVPMINNETPLVAFYATLTADIHGLGKGQNIVFDHAHTNLGNAYHIFHGIFTAPYKGLYMFSATVANIITGSYHIVGTQFVVNGNVVAKTHGHTYDMSSHTLLLELNQGDDFSIQSDGQMMESFILGSQYSSIAGRLITLLQ